jgi:hypothetical protein
MDLEKRSSLINQLGSIPKDKCSYTGQKKGRHTGGNVKTEIEIGVMWPQAKEYHKKLEKAREESPFSECVVLLSPNLISDF